VRSSYEVGSVFETGRLFSKWRHLLYSAHFFDSVLFAASPLVFNDLFLCSLAGLGVCVLLARRRIGSCQRTLYGCAMLGLTIGSIILLVGRAFAQYPPRIQLDSVADFLTSGFTNVANLGLKGSIWVVCQVLGTVVLVLVAESMLFLGLGTLAKTFETSGFWSWLDSMTSRQTRHPRLTVLLIVLFGIIGVLLLGGWGFDLYTLGIKVRGAE
jgi:nitrate reductase NapE component